MTRRERIRRKIKANVCLVAPPEECAHLGPCWEWLGPTSGTGRGGGYPRMKLDGATVAVHIAAWTNEHGLIPPRKQLDHLCRNRPCVSERHLELVTGKRNAKRRSRHSEALRAALGEDDISDADLLGRQTAIRRSRKYRHDGAKRNHKTKRGPQVHFSLLACRTGSVEEAPL